MSSVDVNTEGAIHRRAASLTDLEALDRLPPLRPTTSVARATSQFLGSRDDRAWTLVGPYGAGKSTLSVFLAGVLGARREHPWIRGGIAALSEVDPEVTGMFEEVANDHLLWPCRFKVRQSLCGQNS